MNDVEKLIRLISDSNIINNDIDILRKRATRLEKLTDKHSGKIFVLELFAAAGIWGYLSLKEQIEKMNVRVTSLEVEKDFADMENRIKVQS